MTLLNAAALGTLALAVPILLLYLLKMKRQDRLVPSTILWARLAQDLQASHPFQKLRRNLLLFLQLLMLALLAFALARPAIVSSAPEGRSVALIIDTSASMKAKDAIGGTRFEEARRRAREVVDAMSADAGEAMIVAAGLRTAVRVGLTPDRLALRNALDALEPEDTAADLNPAIRLVAAALRGRSRPEVYLFSDGAGLTLEPVAGLGPIHFIRTGATGDNAAITMLDVRPASASKLSEFKAKGRLAGGKYPCQIFAGLRNFGARPIKGFVTLLHEERVAGAREVEIPAGGDATVLFEVELPAGAARLELDVDDALPSDNAAAFYLRPAKEARIALLNPRSPFFERAFMGFPFVTVHKVNEEALRSEGFDLVVSEGDVPSPLPDAPFVVFRPKGPMPDAPFAGDVEFPEIADWTREHPLLRAVDFVDVHLAASLDCKEPPPGRILMKATGGKPLAVLSQRPGRPFRLAFAFALQDSDWPLRPSFPIFAWNLVQEALESGTVAGIPFLRTGAPAILPSLGGPLRITTPSGAVIDIEDRPGGDPPLFTATTEAGVYQADWSGERRLRFACALLDERESDIAPAESIPYGTDAIKRAPGTAFRHRELWPWLAAALLLLALFEWYAFHRNLGA